MSKTKQVLVSLAIGIVFFLLLNLLGKIPFPKYDPAPDEIATGFSGIVRSIDLGRGLKIMVQGDTNLYRLSGACNDTACLSDSIRIGDFVSKRKGSDTIRLRKGGFGEETLWYIR